MIYIIFVLFNGINGQYRQRPLTVENSATSIYSQNEVSQGNLCGEVTNYVLSAQPQILKSPYYPAAFSSQTQCAWTITTRDPKARMKIVFDDWKMPITGDGCTTTYFQIMDGTGIDSDTGITGMTSSVKLCGKNPGFIVTNSNHASLTLHGDESGLGTIQRFRLTLTKTYERARMLDYDGHAVIDGRPTHTNAATIPKPRVPSRFPPGSLRPGNSPIYPRPNRPTGPSRAGIGTDVRNKAEFQGASYGFTPIRPQLNPVRPIQTSYGHEGTGQRLSNTVNTAIVSEDSEHVTVEKNEISKIGIIFIYIAVILSLIVIAIVIRKKVERKNRDKSNENHEEMKTGKTKENEL